jgi:dolichol-phosphate mannosyltransferase
MTILWLLAALQVVAGAVVITRLSRGRERGAPLQRGAPAPAASISIVIPARDEAERIGPLLEALSRTGPAVREILVVDDRSSDGTGDVVARYAAADHRIRLIAGVERTGVWVGKQHALQQGLTEASAPWTLCLDADARPDPALPDALVAAAADRDFDALTAGPRFAVDTTGETLLHPALLATLVYRFGPPSPRPVSSTRTVANGQCLLVPTERFRQAGGWEPVAANMTEDVALARHLVRTGWALGLVDAAPLLVVDMHASAREAWREWGRSLALPGVAPAREQIVDITTLTLTMALPLPMLIVAAWTGSVLLALPSLILLLVRWLFHVALRPTYDSPSAAYWLAPLVDPLAVVRLLWSALRPNRSWRGRTYARSG